MVSLNLANLLPVDNELPPFFSAIFPQFMASSMLFLKISHKFTLFLHLLMANFLFINTLWHKKLPQNLKHFLRIIRSQTRHNPPSLNMHGYKIFLASSFTIIMKPIIQPMRR